MPEPRVLEEETHQLSSEPVQRSGRELLRAFVRPSGSQLVVGLVLMLVGMMVVTQVQTRQADSTYTSMRRADLVQLLDQLTAESARLGTEINDLQNTRDELASGVDAQRVAAEENQKRLDALRILAGTAPASGPGVRLVIDDPQHKVGPELLLNAVEEMRDAGGEAIAINSTIRVVASSSFARVDGKLAVDGQVVTEPITVDVLGDSHALAEAARFRGGLVSEVQGEDVGGKVTVQPRANLTIKALHTPREAQWARPA